MMNLKFTNTLTSYKNIFSNNLAYAATIISGGYLIKSLFSAINNNRKNKNLDSKIKEIIELEKAKRKEDEKYNKYIKIEEDNSVESQLENTFNNKSNFTILNINNSDIDETKFGNINNQDKKLRKKLKRKELEFFYMIYLKCLKSIYAYEFLEFEISRRKIFKEGNILKYVTYVEKFNNSIKEKEAYILNTLEREMKIDDKLEKEINFNEINTNKIIKKYYEDLDIEIPEELNNEKMNQILQMLFSKTKENIKLIEDLLNLREVNDDEYLIAENMAFDYVYSLYGFEEVQIRKALVKYNLNFEIKKSVCN
jgi:hypothetical protein